MLSPSRHNMTTARPSPVIPILSAQDIMDAKLAYRPFGSLDDSLVIKKTAKPCIAWREVVHVAATCTASNRPPDTSAPVPPPSTPYFSHTIIVFTSKKA